MVTNSAVINSIEQELSELDFGIYPNPVQEQLIIKFNSEINGELILYDAAMKQTGLNKAIFWNKYYNKCFKSTKRNVLFNVHQQ